MDGITTFRDYITECELYPYSQECLDMLRECGELTLINHTIMMGDIVVEGTDLELMESFKDIYTEGYLYEKTDKDKMKKLKEKGGSKAKKVWNKLKSGVRRAVDAVINFFKKIWNKLKGKDDESIEYKVKVHCSGDKVNIKEKIKATFKESVEIGEELDEIMYEAANIDIQKVADVTHAIRKAEQASKFTVRVNKLATTLPKWIKAGKAFDEYTKAGLAILMANEKGTDSIPLDPEENLPNIDEFLGNVDAFIGRAAKKGINRAALSSRTEKLNTNFEKIIAGLEDRKEKLEAIKEEIAAEMGEGYDINEVNKYYNEVIRLSGELMKLYNSYSKFVIMGRNEINKLG